MHSWAMTLVVGAVVLIAGDGWARAGTVDPGTAGDVVAGAPGEVSLRLLRDKGVITAEEYQAALAEVQRREQATAPRQPGVNVSFGRGITLTSPDKQSTATVRARLQVRGTTTVPWSGRQGTNEATVRRARVTLSGQLLAPSLQYQLTLGAGTSDIESGNPVPVIDGFVTWTPWRDLGVQVGQFLIPMDRINTENSFGTQFVDFASVTSEVWLQRDTGINVFSRDLFGLGGRLSYDLGVYAGLGRNRGSAPFGAPELGPWLPGQAAETLRTGVDERFRSWPIPTPNLLLAGRVQYAPLGPVDEAMEGDPERLPNPRVAVGLGGAFLQGAQRNRGTLGEFYKLEGFDYWYGAANIVFKWAGLSLLGEVLTRYAELSYRTGRVANADVKEFSRSATSWLLQGGYMVGPHLELAARWGELIPFQDTDPALRRTHEVGGVVNCLFTDLRSKLQLDYTYLTGDVLEHGVHQVRAQLTYGF